MLNRTLVKHYSYFLQLNYLSVLILHKITLSSMLIEQCFIQKYHSMV